VRPETIRRCCGRPARRRVRLRVQGRHPLRRLDASLSRCFLRTTGRTACAARCARSGVAVTELETDTSGTQ
jgi:hypothetical protein